MDRRQRTYFALRGLAALGIPLSVTLGHGVGAAAVCIGSGLLAVLTCFGTNAGGPGERAGARAQERAYQRIRPPQGEWPPYPAERVVEGELRH